MNMFVEDVTDFVNEQNRKGNLDKYSTYELTYAFIFRREPSHNVTSDVIFADHNSKLVWWDAYQLIDKLKDHSPKKVAPKPKRVWTEEEIWNLVMTNDYFVCACLSKMLDRQTKDEQRDKQTKHTNGRGFNSADAKFLSSLALQARKYRRLYPNQLKYARKCLYKYRKQLVEIANEVA